MLFNVLYWYNSIKIFKTNENKISDIWKLNICFKKIIKNNTNDYLRNDFQQSPLLSLYNH